MIGETNAEAERFWESARRSFATPVKRDLSAVRLPEGRQGLESEFWRRVDVAIEEALAGKRYQE